MLGIISKFFMFLEMVRRVKNINIYCIRWNCAFSGTIWIPDFGVSMAFLNTVDILRRWCKMNFGPLPGHAKSYRFSEQIDAWRQFYRIIFRNWLGQDFEIMICVYYYFLNGIRLDLGLDNSCWIKKHLNLLQTTLTYGFLHTKLSLT